MMKDLNKIMPGRIGLNCMFSMSFRIIQYINRHRVQGDGVRRISEKAKWSNPDE